MHLILLAENIYLIHDYDQVDQERQIESLSLSDGYLTSLSPMNNPRIRPGVVACDDCIRVFGGYDDEQNLSSCEQYDIAANTYAKHNIALTMFISSQLISSHLLNSL